ncbi:hypothetical protein U9M48_019368 [Paspalum notatum var. saurae]|uniref:Uncharacterized protein n=1 Tax=Paspalum notatum var. saurae TaxID=547442 RepID=A0AAQ3TCH0_PASNO
MQGEKAHQKSKSTNKGKSTKGKKKAMENKNSPKLKSSLVYTKPTYKAKQMSNDYILEKKKNGKVVAHTMGWSN